MSDDDNKSDPIEDVRKGLGLLFRAAKTAVQKIPTKNFEEVVVSGAREVGRAVENVASTIEKQVFKRDSSAPAADAKVEDAPPKPPEDAPRADASGGPRVNTDDAPRT